MASSVLDCDFPYPSQRMPIFASNVVATSQPLAAQAGLSMLQQGGNAVDAVLAAAITLTVVEPTSNGIGSDAFAQVWDGEQLHGLNGSGCSPRGWTPGYFAGRKHMPEDGWDTITVPGAVDAWHTLAERFGKLPFGALFKPAVGYAHGGFTVTPRIALAWEQAKQNLGRYEGFSQTFLLDGKAPRAGQKFRCPDLARTLEELAETRGRSFYQGRLAEIIESHARTAGAALGLEDLAGHRSQWVTPLARDYRGLRLHEIPPNGQGLAALIALGLLERFEINRFPVDSADSIHLQIETMKIAFAEAHRHIADPDHMDIAPQDLLDDGFLAQRATEIQMEQASKPRAQIPLEKGTVYLTAADENGMMVSYIQSNYNGFGSGIVIPGTGISFHNRGCGFTLQPGHPNRVGGGKRPFHTIIPGFVTRNGHPQMSFGVMGAHMQAQGHVQMMVRIFDYGQNPQAASDAPRWYVSEDGQVALEPGLEPATVSELRRRGHPMIPEPEMSLFGGAQLIHRQSDGNYAAASDHRKDGQAVGY